MMFHHHMTIVVFTFSFPFVFLQQCRQVTVCNETPGEMVKGDKGDTGHAGKAGPEGRKGETGSMGVKGIKGSKGESCALESFEPVLAKMREDLETLLPPATCWSSSVNGKQILRTGQEVVCDDGWLDVHTLFTTQRPGKYFLSAAFPKSTANELAGLFITLIFTAHRSAGLESIHRVTNNQRCRLRVDLWSTSDVYTFAEFSNFSVGSKSDNYTLHVSGYNGTATDRLTAHNNMPFTTKDRDNDHYPSNCAVRYSSGWWYNRCYSSILNGDSLNHSGDPAWNGGQSKATMKVRCG